MKKTGYTKDSRGLGESVFAWIFIVSSSYKRHGVQLMAGKLNLIRACVFCGVDVPGAGGGAGHFPGWLRFCIADKAVSVRIEIVKQNLVRRKKHESKHRRVGRGSVFY